MFGDPCGYLVAFRPCGGARRQWSAETAVAAARDDVPATLRLVRGDVERCELSRLAGDECLFLLLAWIVVAEMAKDDAIAER